VSIQHVFLWQIYRHNPAIRMTSMTKTLAIQNIVSSKGAVSDNGTLNKEGNSLSSLDIRRNGAVYTPTLLAQFVAKKMIGYFLDDCAKRQNNKKQKILDEKDKLILKYLLFNARAQLREVSDYSKVPLSAVKTKMQYLIESGFIKRFMPLISFAALGYQWFMVFLQLVGVNDKKLVIYMETNPNIEWYIRTIGPWNYQLSIFAKNSKEFHSIMNLLREEFKENIIFFDSILIFDQLKFGCRIS